ncbi:unnamed protein product [Agarophyton chilense]
MEIAFIVAAIACSLGLGGASFQITRRSTQNGSKARSHDDDDAVSQEELCLLQNKESSHSESAEIAGILRKLRKWISPADRARSQDLLHYSYGITEFQKLKEEQKEYFNMLGSTKERVILSLCLSAEDNLESSQLTTRKKVPVRYGVELKDASLFSIACSCLNLNRPFVVQGFNGRKIDGLDLVQGDSWRYYTLSTIINSPLGLSSLCQCGIDRPAEPSVDPKKDIIATIVFRLAWSISKYLPCPCGKDERVSEEERFDMYCRAVFSVCQRLEDVFALMSRNFEHDLWESSWAGIKIRHSRWDRRLNISGNNPSSFGRAMYMVSRMYNTFLLAAYSENEIEELMVPGLPQQILSNESIEIVCARLTEARGAETSLDWLCYNKWNTSEVHCVPTHKLPVHTEIKRAIRFMDSTGVEYLGDMALEELKPARIPFGKERLEWVAFSGGVSEGIPMIRKPQFYTKHNIFCIGRPRVKDIPDVDATQMSFMENGTRVTIAINGDGAVLSFKKTTRNVKKVLRGTLLLTMLDNGLGFNLSRLLGEDLYRDDFMIVNEALSMKYGEEVFDFIISNLMSGKIAVHVNSPAACYVPKTSKRSGGVVLTTPLRGEFWQDKSFVLTQQNLYWLPKQGYNYFKVQRKAVDGLLTMEEVEEIDGQALYKCSAILDTPVV